jgi:hypothetical protein
MRMMAKTSMEEHTSGDGDHMHRTIAWMAAWQERVEDSSQKSKRNSQGAMAAGLGWELGWRPGRKALEEGL